MLCSSMNHFLRRSLVCLGIFLLSLILNSRVQADTLVDLELILAVDVSGSVDKKEYALQMGGFAAAFRDPDIYDAIERGGPNGIAVTVVQWAGRGEQAAAMNWFHLHDRASVEKFAAQLQRLRRHYWGGDTLISQALKFSAREFTGNGFTASRLVIDVSGDGGVEGLGLTLKARNVVVKSGIVVNGLAIETDVMDLREFFRDNVIGGLGSFVMTAADYGDFHTAIRRKLIEEIAPMRVSGVTPS
ncbi:MAG: hypothetical protein COB93_12395 [Sneathiella sp.]|nr:MAG: hypothetical protein COB93_12395 [Sneathiella sp.]